VRPGSEAAMSGELAARSGPVKRLRALLGDPKARRAEQAFVVEGPRAVDAALDRGAPLEAVFFATNADVAFAALAARIREAGVPIEHLKEGVLERLGSTVTPQPVLAIAPMPSPSPDVLASDGLVVVGVALADPGNAGTLLRSAEASGAAAILLSDGSVDAYNPKVVRASAGAIFGVPVLEGWSAVEALDVLGQQGRQRLAADARAGTPYAEVDFTVATAVVLGNEAHGLPSDLDAYLDGRVTVPMYGAAESLNVAMAGVVLCFESARQLAHRTST
jgi:TrmH family RNA methyltransferase